MSAAANSLEALESAVLAAAPEDAPPVAPYLAADDPAPELDDMGEFPGPGADLIPPEVWGEQWAALHDMMGGMVQMRSGKPCPLGDQARSAGGQMAGQAVYALMSSTPFLANMFLSAKSTFVGQVMVIGMHGFACVQIVKAANSPDAPEASA